MRSSLIISVYKDTTSLKAVLDGLRSQTEKNFEVIISEDGESKEMRDFVAGYHSGNDFRHLTQPDVGWRKNQALNNAIRQASSDYLIFIDGDCVLHPRFIENHHRFARPERILAGKRVKLGPEYSTMLRNEIDRLSEFAKKIERQGRKVKKDGARFYEEAFYVSPGGWLGFLPGLRKMTQLKGCNMSFYRQAIEAINGFDEDYILPAIGEDIDLTWRFQGLGFQLFSLRNLAVQYHLYHKENWTDQSENELIMGGKQQNSQFSALNGLKK